MSEDTFQTEEEYVAAQKLRARPTLTGEKVEAVASRLTAVHERLANTPMDMNLVDWGECSGAMRDAAATLAALGAERDELAIRAAVIDEALTNAVHMRRDAESALAAANARVAKGERLASAAENFAGRFSMNDLAEDDDRQRQAVLDQVRLFRARATAAEPALSAANARVERLEKALEWYGSLPKEWTINAGAGATYGDLYMLGERARAAITGGENA